MPSIHDSKCVLVIGATSGLGRALAYSIKALPSKPTVIAAGRRQARLQELASAGFETIQVDVDTDRATLKKFVDGIIDDYPDVREML
jgi:short-subunit dehydrogenase involved in D-alanine esterification of teichoic acids